ncbi:MAG: hypothetical protein ACR2FM_04905 [Candidatus Saccharimonadales bacterium]
MDDKKIHITVTDEETRNAVTYRFDTWGETAKFAEMQKFIEKEKNKEQKDEISPSEAA